MKKILLMLFFPVVVANASDLDSSISPPISEFEIKKTGLDYLKDTPASKYEIGKIQLEFMSFFLDKTLEGERLKDTDFKYKKSSISEDNKYLYFTISVLGKAKYITKESCTKMSEIVNNMIPKNELIHEMWPNLEDQQYQLISEQFIVRTELVSKENSEFKMLCTKKS